MEIEQMFLEMFFEIKNSFSIIKLFLLITSNISLYSLRVMHYLLHSE